MFYRYFLRVASIFTIMSSILMPTSRQFVAAESNKERQEIDSYVLGQMKDLDIPGVAIGIVRGDQIVYTQGYGVADDDRSRHDTRYAFPDRIPEQAHHRDGHHAVSGRGQN